MDETIKSCPIVPFSSHCWMLGRTQKMRGDEERIMRRRIGIILDPD